MGTTLKEQQAKLNSLDKRIAELDERIKAVSKCVTADGTKAKEQIKNYLNGISSVLLKVVKLSEGYLVVKGGKILYKDELQPFPWTAETALQVVDEQTRRINYALKYMSANGVSPRYLAETGKSLNTLYSIFGGADEIDAKTSAKYVEQREKEILSIKEERDGVILEKENLLKEMAGEEEMFRERIKRFYPQGLAFPEQVPKNIGIPFAIDETARTEYEWKPDDGLLLINAEGDYSVTLPLIKTLCIRAAYSYPFAQAQLLYCANELNDEMNTFFSRMDESQFFKGIPYLKDSSGREFGEIFSELATLCSERMKIIGAENCSTVAEYNVKNPDSVQKPVFVILQNYPVGYNGCSDLKYLFSSGKKYGVYFIAVKTKTDLKKDSYSDEYYDDPADYAAISADTAGGKISISGKKVDPAVMGDSDLAEALKPLTEAKKAGKRIVRFEDVGFGTYTESGKDVKETISIPVGKAENKTYSIDFAVAGGENKPIAYLLVGAPNSGKSSLIDSMIFNGCMKYSPDDLNFYLIDFKDGVSSAMYVNKAAMPHIKVVAQRSKKEDAEIILHTILKEQERRNEIFKNSQVTNLARYNALFDKHIPRIIVVIDEASVMFDEDDNNASSVEELIRMCRTIARQGRSAGIHLVLASQAVERKMMAITEFVNGRFCFNANRTAAENTLSLANAKRVPIECKDAGVALASEDSGETVRKVKFGYHCGEEGRYAEAVREKWKAYPVNTAVVGDDSVLEFEEAAKSLTLYPDEIVGPAIGENYYSRSTEYLPFGDINHTLLLIGQDEKIYTDHLISVTAFALKMRADVMLLDESDSQEIENTFGLYGGIKTFNAGSYLEMLSEVYAEYKKRTENRRESYNPYFVILNSLQMVGDFERNTAYSSGGDDKDDFSEDGFISLRSIRERSSAAQEINGKDTLLEIFSHAGRAKNFFVCISLDKAGSVEMRHLDAISQADFKIMCYPFVESMGDVCGRVYNNKLGASCSRGISLLSVKGQTMEKIRYFHYEDTPNTRKYISKEIE